MSETTHPPACGKCGAALGGSAPEGLCASCLLESAIDVPEGADVEPFGSKTARVFLDYEILGEIARGGMGVVYRARQLSLNRPVALKMILGGHLANEAEMKRFRTEAETAAQLQHPNIVAIHEVGELAGQPFFSMDLVEGRNLAQLVHDEPLPSRRAATYLKTIAQAVQYAHSRGVLHRDLKPSNILIDDNEQPRITDFGLAKRLETDTSLTLTGQVLGSPSFIPPEQAGGRKGAIGPASDVYSLGAILYQCLTARPPFVGETLTQTLRMVAEQDPVAPRLLNPSVPRDLETICVKCLEKDPARRYSTAQELGDDLGRFLRNEPIHARPASVVLKLHRWCLRNKPLAVTGTAILLLLLVVAIGSPIAAFRINRARLEAQASRIKAEAFGEFFSKILEGAGPSAARGRDKTLMMEILSNAVVRVSAELTNQPEVEADVRLVIGGTYYDLGDLTNALAMTKEALRLREAHFGPRHISVARALNNLGAILAEMGDPAGAEAYDRRALELKIALLGNEDPDVATTMSNLGLRLQSQGKFAQAEPLLRNALKIRLKRLGPEHRDVAMSRNNLAMLLWDRGEFDEAESQFREALDIFRKLYPGDHPDVATMLNNIGEVYRSLGRLGDAEMMMGDALAMRQRVLGLTNRFTSYSQQNLATILERQGKLEQAERLHQEALAHLQASLGTNHPWVAEALCNFGLLKGRKGELPAAEAMQRSSLATAERALGKDNVGSAEALGRLAAILAVRGNIADASALLTNELAIVVKASGDEHPDLIPALRHLAWVLSKQGDSTAAESLNAKATSLSHKGGNYSIRAFTDSNYDLADLLQGQKRFAEAETLLLENATYLKGKSQSAQIFEPLLFGRLVAFYEAWERAEPGAGKTEQVAAWRKKL